MTQLKPLEDNDVEQVPFCWQSAVIGGVIGLGFGLIAGMSFWALLVNLVTD